MISLKKYLDSTSGDAKESAGNGAREFVEYSAKAQAEHDGKRLLPVALTAYRSALLEMGNCSQNACPALGDELKHGLQRIEECLFPGVTAEVVQETERSVQEQLQAWGQRTALHYRQKTGEIKEILIVMAQTAESVGERDQRCAQQITDVTTRLRKVANLEDLSQIRRSIEDSAAELKTSIDRMSEEGKAVIAQLRAEVSNYQAKLEEAEHVASCDSLTGLRNRLSLEGQIERRLGTVLPFCVAIVDINAFKKVNDEHGHLAGDELLRQFAAKLTSICRSTDLIGRWGGDEFILLLDGGIQEAKTQIDRIRKTVCGSYAFSGRSGPIKMQVEASIGVAEHAQNETLKELLAHADAAMYDEKGVSHAAGRASKR